MIGLSWASALWLLADPQKGTNVSSCVNAANTVVGGVGLPVLCVIAISPTRHGLSNLHPPGTHRPGHTVIPATAIKSTECETKWLAAQVAIVGRNQDWG